MLYFVQATVQARVFGISGPFEQQITQLVEANTSAEAKTKFERFVCQQKSNMEPESVQFKYHVIAGTIK
jgi:hypothetical protein